MIPIWILDKRGGQCSIDQPVDRGEGGGGVGQALRIMGKNYIPFLHRHAQSLQRFTEIEQVNACNTQVLKVEHLYIVREFEYGIWVSSPSVPRKLHVAEYSNKPKCMF